MNNCKVKWIWHQITIYRWSLIKFIQKSWLNVNLTKNSRHASVINSFSTTGLYCICDWRRERGGNNNQPALGSLKSTCSEHFGLSSIACRLALGVFIRLCTNGVSLHRRIASVAPPNKPQTTLSQRAPYIGHLKGWLVWRFWMTILDAGLIPQQPLASDLNRKWMLGSDAEITWKRPHEEKQSATNTLKCRLISKNHN